MAEAIRISDLFRNARLTLGNGLRRLRRGDLDYVVLELHGAFPERTPRPRRSFPWTLLPWPTPPPSVEAFTTTLELLAGDDRVQGVLFLISDLAAGVGTLTSLRQAVARFRESGKRTVAYLQQPGMWSYYLAAACEQILAPESASIHTAGLWTEALFLRDTLALAGIEADFEAIAEYKVSPDMFRRSEMTEPHREMLESILDSLYDEVTGAIATGRGLTPERVRELLDSVPLTAQQAGEAGLLDGVCYEDELAALLGKPGAPATIVPWDQARGRVLRPRRWRSRQAIGVISLEGMITLGSSRRSPFPLPVPLPFTSQQAGSGTLVQQIRAAAQDKHIAAVVLHVDSPGGSALASDLIWRELENLNRKKPLVVYMSNQAASGGYYVSAPARAIYAQPTTLTGSIGIWGGKIVTRRLFEKMQAGRHVVSRGAAAGLYADTARFSDEERAKIRAEIGSGYARFKERVAQGRGLSEEEVETVARGRVWTGEQALARGLVDQLGDLQAAARRARELANLSPRRYAPLVSVPAPKRHLWAEPQRSEAGEWLAAWAALSREAVYALAPWTIRIRI